MWKATIRGLLARRLRFALTVAAVVIGVAFVTGTYLLTDTLRQVAADLFADASLGIDVTVRSQSEAGSGLGAERTRLSETLLSVVERVEGVRDAEGTLAGIVSIVGPDGEVLPIQAGPNVGFSWPRVDELGPLRIRDGRRPEREGEVAVDVATARREQIDVGDSIGVVALGPVEQFRVVGTLAFGNAESAGPSVVAFSTLTAQRVFEAPGLFDTISVAGEGGVLTEELRARVAEVLPPGVEAVTGQAAAAEDAESLQEVFGLVGSLVLVFAAVGLFAGAFIVFNTFAMVVAQRARELGLLRALGAEPGQLLRSVLVEATVVGAGGAALGLVAGAGLAFGLLGLVRRAGVAIPDAPLVVAPRTVLVGAGVGVLVTVVAALGPARRAYRTSALEALAEAPSGSVRALRTSVVGALWCCLAIVLLAGALADGSAGSLVVVGAGALALVVGVIWLGPVTVPWLGRALGLPLTMAGGIAGRLAHQNALRNPRRSAGTAAALLIGVSLMTLTAVAASSARASISNELENGVEADLVLSAAEFFPFPAEVLPALEQIDEVTEVASLRLASGRIDGSSARIAAVDPARFPRLVDLDIVAGTLPDPLGYDQVLVHEGTARNRGWSLGDSIDVAYPQAGTRAATVVGIFRRNQVVFANFVMSIAAFEAGFASQQDSLLFVDIAASVSPAAGRAAVQAALDSYPNVEVRDREEFDGYLDDQVGRVLGVLYALLALAVLTGVLGIVNTLSLSVFERTRELGLLRAVGMSRRQVRAMVAAEAVVLALTGAALGLGLGTFLAWVIARVLADDGVSVFAVPAGQLIAFFVLSAAAGLVAAVLPAWRAGRTDVLEAIAR